MQMKKKIDNNHNHALTLWIDDSKQWEGRLFKIKKRRNGAGASTQDAVVVHGIDQILQWPDILLVQQIKLSTKADKVRK